MKPIRRILDSSQFTFTLLLALGIALWFAATATLGEHYATAVGPDWLIKLPVALAKLAVIMGLSRWIIAHRFPTVFAFTQSKPVRTTTGADGKPAFVYHESPESDFARAWRSPLQNHHDPRLGLAIHTYLGVYFIISLIVLFAF